MIEATDANFDSLVSEGVVLVDFYAPWCGPCRALAPVLEQLSGAKIVKVDVDQAPSLATRFNVSSIPKLVLMKDGQVFTEMVGMRGQSDLQNQINEARTTPDPGGKVSVYDNNGNRIGAQG